MSAQYFNNDSFKKNYEEYYVSTNLYPPLEEIQTIYEAFYRVVSKQCFLDLIVFYNDHFQVPPVVSFLRIEYSLIAEVSDEEKFIKISKNGKDNQILGAFFGCLFYKEFKYFEEKGTEKDREKNINFPPIKSATYFIK